MLEVRCWFRDSRQFNFVFLTFPKSIGRITTNSSCTNGQWSQSSESSAAVHHSEATSFNKTKSGLTPQTRTLPQHVGLIANCVFSQTKNHPACTNGATFPSIHLSILSLSFSFLASTIDTKLWLHNFSQYFLQNAGSSSCSCVKMWKTWSKNRGRWEQLTLSVGYPPQVEICRLQLHESKKSKKHTEATPQHALGNWMISAKAINCMELQIFIFKVHNQKSRSSGGKAANLVPHQSVWILSSYRNRAAGSLGSLNTELQSIAALTSR